MSPYRFENHGHEMPGYGPKTAIFLRATDELLGYVRRIIEPQVRGENWRVYDGYGNEVAVADQRTTAASFLKRKTERDKENAQ